MIVLLFAVITGVSPSIESVVCDPIHWSTSRHVDLYESPALLTRDTTFIEVHLPLWSYRYNPRYNHLSKVEDISRVPRAVHLSYLNVGFLYTP